MGVDKAALVLGGENLLDRALRRLRLAGVERYVLGHDPSASTELVADDDGTARLRDGVQHVPDSHRGDGPLAAFANLETSLPVDVEHVFLAAVDMPFLDATVVQRLLAFRAGLTDDCDVVLPRVGGRDQPLAALWHRRALVVARKLIRRDERSMKALVANLAAERMDEARLAGHGIDADAFRGFNSQEELAALRAEIERHPRGADS